MHILIGVDGSQAAEVACEFVANRTWPIGTRIELVGAISPELIKRDRIVARDELRQTLDDRGDSLRKAGMTVSTEVIDGAQAESLVDHQRYSIGAGTVRRSHWHVCWLDSCQARTKTGGRTRATGTTTGRSTSRLY